MVKAAGLTRRSRPPSAVTHVGREQEVPALTPRPARTPAAALAVRAGLVALAAAVLFFCYWRQSQAVPLSSDGSSNVLQAWAMLHGNLLLHNWWVSDVSFYTTELPQYMLIEALTGLGPWVVHAAAAMTYTLLVLLAAVLAKGRVQGGAGWARALLAAGLMLSPQLGATSILLLSPDHTGTAVPLLVIWLLIDRARPRWYVPVLVGPAVHRDHGGRLDHPAHRHRPAGARRRGARGRRADQAREAGRVRLVRAEPGRRGGRGRGGRIVRAAGDGRPGRVPAVTRRDRHGPEPAAARVLGDPPGLPRALRRERLRPQLLRHPARARGRLRGGSPGRGDPGDLGSRGWPGADLPPRRADRAGVRGGHRGQPGRLHDQHARAGPARRARDGGGAAARGGAGRAPSRRPDSGLDPGGQALVRPGALRADGRLPGRARIRRRPGPGSGPERAPGQLAGGARAHPRAGQLLAGQQHDRGQQRPRRGQRGGAGCPLPPRAVPVGERRRELRPGAALRELRRGGRPRRLAGHAAVRAAHVRPPGADLPRRRLHDPGLEHERAGQAGRGRPEPGAAGTGGVTCTECGAWPPPPARAARMRRSCRDRPRTGSAAACSPSGPAPSGRAR